jgi:MYXO-CTERM domain-containing protein
LTSCNLNTECASGFFCKNNACVPAYANGQPGSTAVECGSGHCTEGVCCDQDCAGDGTCDASGLCNKVRTQGTPCALPACNGSELDKKECDGFGACQPVVVTCDKGYVCDTTLKACKQSCATVDDCASGYYCTQGACKDSKADGSACSVAEECKSGFCTEGICCNEACDAPCKSCMATLTEQANGKCNNVLAATKDPKNICKVATNVCAGDGTCDGSGACTKAAAQGTKCGDNACSATAVMQSQCDGKSACTQTQLKNCTPYACDTATLNCKTKCQAAADCASGAVCDKTTSQCAASDATCKDGHTVLAAGGATTDCSPYACAAGACKASCQTSADCVSGYVCDPTQAQGVCISQAGDGSAASSDSGGCGCRTPASSSSGAAGGAFAALLALAARRRRRARTSARRAWQR